MENDIKKKKKKKKDLAFISVEMSVFLWQLETQLFVYPYI